MARRTPPRRVRYFEPVALRLARNTIIESTLRSAAGSAARCASIAANWAPAGTGQNFLRLVISRPRRAARSATDRCS